MEKNKHWIGNTFRDKPDRINKTGKNRKTATAIVAYMKREYGIKPLKAEIRDMMEMVESLPAKELRKFVKDPLIPVIVQNYGKLLLTGNSYDFRRVQGSEILNDRINGKVKQQVDLSLVDRIKEVANMFPTQEELDQDNK
jgi:hypothetical protein